METTSSVRFRLREPLGRTPACQVWRAHDAAAGEDIAVKVINVRSAADEAHADRFWREAQQAADLHHPHILGIRDTGVSDDRPYVTMPLMAGDLRAVLADGPLSAKRAVTIVEHVAAALDAARVEGLVHGDVKPSNVLFDSDGVALLGDFGAARGTDRDNADAITSWAYYAPEYLIEGTCDARTDVYALAGVLYYCFTGRDPFSGTVEQQIGAHLVEAPPRPSEVRPELPGALDAVIATGMAKDPELRYPTARALAGAARAAFKKGRPEARETPAPKPPVSSVPARLPPMTIAIPYEAMTPVEVRRPRRLVYGGSALILAAVTAIAAIATYLGREQAPTPLPLDGTYSAQFGSTLTLDGARPSDAGRAMMTTTISLRSTCPTDGCVAVATVTGDALSDSVEPATATQQFVMDAIDGSWVSVTEAGDGKAEQWRVLSLRQDASGLAGTYSYVADGRGAQRPVTLVRTGDVPPDTGAEDPATVPPLVRSPAQNLRGAYEWTRTAVNLTAGAVDKPVEVVTGLRTFTNCLRTGERCFSLLANSANDGVLMTYAAGTWTSRVDREMECGDGGVTQSVRTFELPMPATAPDPVQLLQGRGHMENTGNCALSTDTEIKLQRTGD